MSDNDGVIVWNDDGHAMRLLLQRDTILVTGVICPGGDDRACAHPQTDCVVEWFLETYGLDCHVGICFPAEKVPLAWAIVGNPNDLEDSQVWLVSTTDDLFRAWRDAQ